MDESDAVSLTSTINSEPQDQYFIDRILAEREQDGETQYLVAWEGYPEDRHTWEPLASFTSTQPIHDWREDRMRVTRGLNQPFDVTAWEDRVAALWQVTLDRKKLRRRKRREAGWQLEDSDNTAAEGSQESTQPDIDMEESTSQHSDASIPSQPGSQRGSRLEPHTTMKEPSHAQQIQQTTHFSQEKPNIWTDEETLALENAIKRIGHPHMDRVLGLHGERGSVNDILANRTVLELQAKAFSMKQEVINSGRPLPKYHSMVASPQETSLSDLSVPSNERLHAQRKPVTSSQSRYVGTARPSSVPSPTFTQKAATLQLGSIGSGPARPPIVPIQTHQPPGMTPQVDITANWNAVPSVQKKTRTLKRNFKNLNHRYNTNKRNNEEPTPDIGSLIFIDTKTGKVPRALNSKDPIPITPTADKPERSNFCEKIERFTAARKRRMQDQTITIDDNERSKEPAPGEQPVLSQTGPLQTPHEHQSNLQNETPTAPKAQIEWQRRDSKPDLHFTTASSIQNTDRGDLHPTPKQSSKASTSSLILRKWPAQHERMSLQQIRDKNLVIGVILTKRAGRICEVGKVRFMGFVNKWEQRVVLNIRKPDGRVEFEFFQRFTAMEYVQLPALPNSVSQPYSLTSKI